MVNKTNVVWKYKISNVYIPITVYLLPRFFPKIHKKSICTVEGKNTNIIKMFEYCHRPLYIDYLVNIYTVLGNVFVCNRNINMYSLPLLKTETLISCICYMSEKITQYAKSIIKNIYQCICLFINI